MANLGKCPKCERVVTAVTVESVSIQGGGRTYKGVSYVCSGCHSVLSIEIDPIAVAQDLAKKMKRPL